MIRIFQSTMPMRDLVKVEDGDEPVATASDVEARLPKVLDSSMRRRFYKLRHDLTLSLYLNDGAFWEAVNDIRTGYSIVPRFRVELDTLSFAGELASILGDLGWLLDKGFALNLRSDLARDIATVASQFVPANCWIGRDHEPRLSPGQVWEDFVLACVLCDPAPEQLLDFADFVVTLQRNGDWFSTPWFEWLKDGELFQAFAPSVRFLPEPEDVANAVHERYRTLLNALDQRLRAKGIDVWHEVAKIDEDAPKLSASSATTGAQDGTPYPRQPYIRFDEDSTEEDVTTAYRWLRDFREWPGKKTKKKASRDHLVAVQCALWHDQFEVTFAEIGAYLGFAIQRDAYGKPRCETARQYVVLGRRILDQKRAAA